HHYSEGARSGFAQASQICAAGIRRNERSPLEDSARRRVESWDIDDPEGSSGPDNVDYYFVENTLRRIASPAPPSTVSNRKIEDGSGTDDSGSPALESTPVISPLRV